MQKQRIYPKTVYPFESKWINIKGNNIHYIDEGKGKTILFCHPPVSSSFMYRNLIKQLSVCYRCVTLDFPGFGLSDAAPDYDQSIRSQSVIIESFLEQLQLKEIFLLMQEVGGHATIIALMKQPANLKGIILTDTIIFPVSAYPKIFKMLNFVNGGIFNFLNCNFNLLIRAMTRFGINNRKLSKEERNVYKELFNTKEKRELITFMLHQLVVEEPLLRNIQTAFETIFNKVPALLIYGSKDPLHKLGIPERINAMLTNSELHFIIGEGHFPHEGEPEKMTVIIKDWMNKRE
ncbi:MAG TPA: alpha/beta fold hydrolase [Chitinophagaceae bacterium]|nr:alpha/beta fold hydrolase [Chitinophagaceae bacterium]